MTTYEPANPLIVQSDHTVLVEVDSPRYEAARNELVRFAELVKSPEHIHTYRITPLSIWNARAAGISAAEISEGLQRFSKYQVPEHVLVEIDDFASRFGRLRILVDSGELILCADTEPLAEEIAHSKTAAGLLSVRLSGTVFRIHPLNRGKIKQALIKIGYPAEDLAGYTLGAPVRFAVRDTTQAGDKFRFRPYQQQAADTFYAGGSERGGAGG